MDFRRGIEAINKASEGNRRESAPFSPFAPSVAWREDKEEKYILFLNPAEDIPTLKMHEWIEVGKRPNGKPIYEWFISRRDEAIGENYDDIEDRLGQPARERTLAVAVELEPTIENIKGRKRPTGFEVKTDTYERKSDDGPVEVVTPVLGFVVQSPQNFFGWVGSFNENTAPIEETPLRVERRGKDANTQYDFTAFIDQPVDLTHLVEYIGGVSYLGDEELDLEGVETDQAGLIIGKVMLERRLEELADAERYTRLVKDIQDLPDRFGKQDKPRRKATSTTSEEKPAPARARFAQLRQEVEANR